MRVAAAVLYRGVVCVVWIKSRRTHDMVFVRPTVPMYQPVRDCRLSYCMPSCGMAGWQRPCGTALSFTIMLQRLPVKLWLIGYSCVIISDCTIFTNLARLKFPYENRLVEISRELYEKIVYDLCPSSI